MELFRKRKQKKLLVVLYTIIVFILFSEFILFITDYDTKLLWWSLYKIKSSLDYSNDFQIYRHSNNSEKLYELIPNRTVKCVNCTTRYENYSDFIISVNSLGFRDVGRKAVKPEDVFRIIILGGSNTFGLRVDNNDTYPMQLQKILDRDYPGKFEVWNAGTSGYVMSQKVNYAEEIVQKYDPDLIVFQDFNIGRRAFFSGDDEFTNHFKQNKELYIENIPFLITNRVEENYDTFNLHYYLVLHSRVYRFVVVSLNNIIINRIVRECFTIEDLKTSCFDDKLDDKYDSYGTYISYEKTKGFLKNNPEVEVIIFDNLRESYCDDEYSLPYSNYSHVTYYSICDRPNSTEYYEIHPPTYVYTFYAEKLKEQVLTIYNQQNI